MAEIESQEPNAKVLFRVPSNDPDDDSADVETLWAVSLEDHHYKLDNIPYFAYSVSDGDIVYAPFDPDEGFPTFHRVAKKSGNRTIRLIFEIPYEEGNETAAILDDLRELGADFEGANKRYICLNIPPASDFDAVAEYLINNGV